MIFDSTELFSNNQAITGSTVSTHIFDLGPTGVVYPAGAPPQRDIGFGHPIPLTIWITQTFNNLTSLTVSIEGANDQAFSAPIVLATSPAYDVSRLTAGFQLQPRKIPSTRGMRYLRARYTVAGTAPTTGAITGGVTLGSQTNA